MSGKLVKAQLYDTILPRHLKHHDQLWKPITAKLSEQHGLDEGNRKRIGLHSLPQADSFYRDRCRMSDLGRDASKQNLTYFEMTDAQAAQFLREITQ